ncbi:MAG: 5'-methylthioadenosine/adenosylhomocysteine nucleosidase [Bacillota bacterium]|nr:5'-methylthioadenosine/adenosylhomocysteine nucleosidase [Bacillota bacterium]
MIGIIGAMDIEVNSLKNAVENAQIIKISGIDFVSGKIDGKNVVIAKAGVGKVNAAVCAQTMILAFHPDVVVNTGVAGSLSSAAGVGDIVIGTAVVQHDMDTTPLGDPSGLIPGIDMVNMPCSEKARVLLVKCAKKIEGVKALSGIIATGDIFLNSIEKKSWIADTFGAVAGEMEGGSIGQVCIINGVDFAVVRAISDNADGSSHIDFNEFVALAAKNSAGLILEFISRY